MTPLQTINHHLLQRLALTGLVLIALIARPSLADAVRDMDLQLAGGVTVPVRINPAAGNHLLLWLPSEYGFVDESRQIADEVAAAGIEVWQADLFGAHFFAPVPSSIYKVPAKDIAGVIDHAIRKTGKTVTIFADGRGAVLVLRGVKQWQVLNAKRDANRLRHALLLSPNLYTETPPPGEIAHYLPIARQSALDMVVLQPMMSPWYWWRDRLKTELTQNGSRCQIQVLPGVRDRFFFRPDATAAENSLAIRLSALIVKSITTPDQLKEIPQ